MIKINFKFWITHKILNSPLNTYNIKIYFSEQNIIRIREYQSNIKLIFLCENSYIYEYSKFCISKNFLWSSFMSANVFDRLVSDSLNRKYRLVEFAKHKHSEEEIKWTEQLAYNHRLSVSIKPNCLNSGIKSNVGTEKNTDDIRPMIRNHHFNSFPKSNIKINKTKDNDSEIKSVKSYIKSVRKKIRSSMCYSYDPHLISMKSLVSRVEVYPEPALPIPMELTKPMSSTCFSLDAF